MKRFLKFATLLILLFNTGGALYGGYNLVIYPDGSSLGLPLSLLQYSGFHNYTIPGIILFAFNGLFGIIVLTVVILKAAHYLLFISLQGIILTAWIIIQVLLIRMVSPFHIVLVCMGITLIAVGFMNAAAPLNSRCNLKPPV